jgi:hypothetical protein
VSSTISIARGMSRRRRVSAAVRILTSTGIGLYERNVSQTCGSIVAEIFWQVGRGAFWLTRWLKSGLDGCPGSRRRRVLVHAEGSDGKATEPPI